jgi:hypothetical protein
MSNYRIEYDPLAQLAIVWWIATQNPSPLTSCVRYRMEKSG